MAHKITIVGCGPGSQEYLTEAAVRAVQAAEVLVGAQRLLDMFPGSRAERIPLGSKLQESLDLVANRLAGHSVAILVSGDPGIFSLAKLVIRRFGRQSCRIIPGISSVQAAFACIGLDWADAKIISAHKTDPDREMAGSLKDCDKIAVLAGRNESLAWIQRTVQEVCCNHRIFVCEDLSLEEERVQEISAHDLADLEVSTRTVVLLVERGLMA